MIDKITIASNCYEMDYKVVLSKKYLSMLLHSNNPIFETRIMTLNDINNIDEARYILQTRKTDCNLTNYYVVAEECDDVMNYYDGCSRESFIQKYPLIKSIKYSIKNRKKFKREFDGYNFSLPVMTAIKNCKTRWLLWCDEDALFEDHDAQEWINKSIELMKNRPDVLVANPIWNNEYESAKNQAISEDEFFLYSNGFSIQCFLIDLEKIMNNKKIYSEKNTLSEITYPVYGGNCFEKRINAYMLNHHFTRATYKLCSYHHESFTEKIINELLDRNEDK